jgi:nitric oxide reductase NorD protein
MLDWEENLFLGLKALYRRAVVTPQERRRASVRVWLKDERTSLLRLGEMLAGRPLAVFETPEAVLCGGERLFLPREFSVARSVAGNLALYQVKTILGALALRDGWRPSDGSLVERASRCYAEFPGLESRIESLRQDLPPPMDLWQTLGQIPDGVRDPGEQVSETLPDPNASTGRVTTEVEGKGQANVEVRPAQDDDGVGAETPMHTFEKVETLEEYTGQSRKSDAEDELEDHLEALQSINMTQVLRSAERPRSIYRSDMILDGAALEVGSVQATDGIPYPEWDHRRHTYRDAWCLVKERAVTTSKPGWSEDVAVRHRRLIHQLRRQFATLTSDWLRLRRQPVGNEFDVDAVVDSEVERRTGHTPSESIYLDRRRDLHDIAALILLDESYSTDAWIDNRRVLDIICETVFCVGDVLEDYIERFALATFTSHTRRSCEFNVVKDFKEPWRTTSGRLGTLEPRGYTRIGPALRHAQERLAQEKASRKIIILLTDGRPCDYDRYEGTYGIKDVKKALEVGRLNGIQTHAFAIEKQAAEYFPQMFTQHHYDILRTPDRLAQTMSKLFARLLAA